MYNTFEEVARRYAKALFEIAEEQNKMETISQSMVEMSAMFVASSDLRRVVRTPGIAPEIFSEIFEEILKKMGAGKILHRFVGLLCNRKRVFLIPSIIRHYEAMLREYRGEITAAVTSAQTLDDKQLAALTKALQPFAGRGSVTVQHKIDSSLIGGLKILLGPQLLDLSVKHRLEAIHRTLKEA